MTDQRAEAILNAAITCYEVDRAYKLFLGDSSLPPWDEAPKQKKESMVSMAVAIFTDLDHGGDFNPKAFHGVWLEHKRKNGWRYGRTEDAERKEHPLILPYEMLPDVEKAKDYVLRGICDRYWRTLPKQEATVPEGDPQPTPGTVG